MCVAQDEIESVGRCRDLEALGYDSKQSYYIKCPACCASEGFTPTGVVGDQHQTNQEPPAIAAAAAAAESTKSPGRCVV